MEFVLTSVAEKSTGFVANYPKRGLTYAKLSDLQKKRLHEAYKLLNDKEQILTKFNELGSAFYQLYVKSESETLERSYWATVSAFLQTLSFLMGMAGSLILFILAFYDSMEHDTYNRLNKSSAILLLLFTFIGAAKDMRTALPVLRDPKFLQAVVEPFF